MLFPWKLSRALHQTEVGLHALALPPPSSRRAAGRGGEGGHGDLGLRRFGAGGVAGMCGERACSMCVRAGLREVRSGLAGRVSGAAGRLRTGV